MTPTTTKTVRAAWLFPLAAATTALALPAQTLVRDIRPAASTNGGSSPTRFVDGGSRAFFTATTSDAGAEPFVTDGTTAGTRRIADLVSGSEGSLPLVLFAHQGTALLTAALPEVGNPLYLTDGTTVQPVGDLGLPAGAFRAARLANGRVLLTHTPAGSSTSQAYLSDLTAAGTVPVPGLPEFTPLLTTSGGLTYGLASFVGSTSPYVADLWVSDGTVAGTRFVATDCLSSQVVNNPLERSGPVEWNGRVWFLRTNGPAINLWSTDGTVAGTTLHAFVGGSFLSFAVERLHVAGNRLVFRFNSQLFAADATSAGPVPNLPCDTVGTLVTFQNRVYFSAVGTGVGFELWSSDGTGPGTALVADLWSGPPNGSPQSLAASPQGVWLRTMTPSGMQLALCTGPTSCQLLGALPGSSTSELVPFAGGVLLAQTAIGRGMEPWFATPTQAPAMLRDLETTQAGIDPRVAVRGRTRLFFPATDGSTGVEPWSTDGTAAGTVGVDLTPGTGSTLNSAQPRIVTFGDGFAAVRSQSGSLQPLALVGDGTSAGTRLLPIVSNGFDSVNVCTDGRVLFFDDGRNVWRSDGTAAGTTLLPAVLPSMTISRTSHVLPGRLVVLGFPGGVGTDGLQVESLTTSAFATFVGALPTRIVFHDDRGLVATDGTVAGTTVLAAGVPAPSQAARGGNVVFALSNGTLWRTDGTAAGTVSVGSVPTTLTVRKLIATTNGLFAVATDATSGRELHRLDAAAGTFVLVTDLLPGMGSGVVDAAPVGDGALMFLAATDGTAGVEPWVTDGTGAGTRPLGDVRPGVESSNPRFLGVAGALAYFTADDGVVGRELWSVPLATLGAGSLQEIEAGCLGSAGRPSLAATSLPAPGNAAFAYRLAATAPGALVGLLVGTRLSDVQLFGCRVAPAGSTGISLGQASLAGSATFPLSIPNVAALVGVQLTAQGFGLDAAAPAGFAGSNGVLTVIGR